MDFLSVRKSAAVASLAIALATSVNLASAVGALAKDKVWTIDTRAARLMQEINEGQKNGELTVKEAKKLRSDLADIAHRKKLMKGDNDGKVSPEDRNKIEGDLNKVSAKIKKLELEKRVEHK
ncbi:MAG: hypothetical protein KGS72_18160 [Cyanobacteria bacterium REEB67]|nr:hypothetical protein [Cyanobacteria bacterium REEB67]